MTKDGNLGAHLRRLEEAGYIRVRKTFVGRRPRTYPSATELGRHAFQRYRDVLRALFETPEGPAPASAR